MSQARQLLGAEGEAAVAHWYQERGFKLLDQNWHCPEGEIDLVLRKGKVTVFCEVKTRSTDAFGGGLDAVNRSKQTKVRKSAVRWLTQVDAPLGGNIRFDIAAVTGADVVVVEDAF